MTGHAALLVQIQTLWLRRRAITAIVIWFGSDAAIINERVAPFAIIVVALTIIFVGIAWRTTEGGWRWRWGGDKR